MKTLFFLLLLSPSVFAGDLMGFRGLDWGSLKTPDMSLQRKDSTYVPVDVCLRQGDPLEMGGVKLSTLIYVYWEDRLCSVDMGGEGYQNCLLLASYLQQQYGECFQPRPFIPYYVWDLPSGAIALEYRAFPNGTYTCLLISKQMIQKMKGEK
jgi:hypothetical protein